MAKDVRVTQQPLALASLIATPLRALLHAQAQAELETLEYIVEVGLGGHDRMRAETLEFQLDQPIPDPLRPGESTAVPTRVTVPLLSLLNIPSVRVREADISFLVHVSQTIEGERPTRIGRSFGREVEIRGVYGARGDRNARPSLSLQLRLESTPEGEPLERVKRLLGDATMAVAEPTSKSKSVKPGSARVAPRRSTGTG